MPLPPSPSHLRPRRGLAPDTLNTRASSAWLIPSTVDLPQVRKSHDRSCAFEGKLYGDILDVQTHGRDLRWAASRAPYLLGIAYSEDGTDIPIRSAAQYHLYEDFDEYEPTDPDGVLDVLHRAVNHSRSWGITNPCLQGRGDPRSSCDVASLD